MPLLESIPEPMMTQRLIGFMRKAPGNCWEGGFATNCRKCMYHLFEDANTGVVLTELSGLLL